MKYFAYGSNMLEGRLRSPGRVPGATFLTTGNVQGYKLQFHKQSIDESAKGNIVQTGSIEDVVYGVVFELPKEQIEALDSAEGVGHGYHRDYNIPVRLADGTEERVLAYIADANAINDRLIPYVWYHRLVIAGAEQHQLPPEYISVLKAVPCSEDTEQNRPTKLEAEAALDAYYGNVGSGG